MITTVAIVVDHETKIMRSLTAPSMHRLYSVSGVENRPVDPGSVQKSHWLMSLIVEHVWSTFRKTCGTLS